MFGPELSQRLSSNPVVPILVEADTSHLTHVRSVLPLSPERETCFRQIPDSVYLPSYATLKAAKAIAQTEGVRKIYFNRTYRQTFFSNIRNVAYGPLMYKLEPGMITTGMLRPLYHLEEADENGVNGKGVKVAVIDTGFSDNRQLHYADVPTHSVKTGEMSYVDSSGHSTHICTTIAGRKVVLDSSVQNGFIQGLATGARVYAIRALYTPLGAGTMSDVLEGMRYALDTVKADILSMSLGSETVTPDDDPTKAVIDTYSAQGRLMCVAAGNSGSGCKSQSINSPGDVENAITVGSMSSIDKARAYFSSIGPTADGRIKSDVMAHGGGRSSSESEPGETIVSSSSGLLDAMDKKTDRVADIMGTSQATPCVSSILALWKQLHPDLNTIGVKDIFKRFGVSKNNETGWGLIDYRWGTD